MFSYRITCKEELIFDSGKLTKYSDAKHAYEAAIEHYKALLTIYPDCYDLHIKIINNATGEEV